MSNPRTHWNTLGHHHDRMHDEPGDIMGKIPHAAIHAIEAITLRDISPTIEDLKGSTMPGDIFNRGLGNDLNPANLPLRRGFDNLLKPEKRTCVPLDFSDPFPGAFAPQDTPGFQIKTDPLVVDWEMPKSPSLPGLMKHLQRVLDPDFSPTPRVAIDPLPSLPKRDFKPYTPFVPEPFPRYTVPNTPDVDPLRFLKAALREPEPEPSYMRYAKDIDLPEFKTTPSLPLWSGKPQEPDPIPANDYMKLVRDLNKPDPLMDIPTYELPKMEDRYAPYKVGSIAPPEPYKIDPNPRGMTDYCNDIMKTMGSTVAYEPDPGWKLQHQIIDDLNDHHTRTSFASPCAALPEPFRFKPSLEPNPIGEAPGVTAAMESFVMAHHQARTIF